MEIQSGKKTEDTLTFTLLKSKPSFANALRRTILTEVPTMAIEDIEFIKNNSVLYDEMIGLRLGLLSLKTDLKSYDLPENCGCKGEGCAKCQLKLNMSAKGPGAIYASEIKSTDPKVVPVHPKTIITKVLKGQEVEFEATAILGKGKDHMKWSPGHVFYTHQPTIKANKSQSDKVNSIIKACHKSGENKIALLDKKASHICDACWQKMEQEGIEIVEDKESFVFTIESWGQLPPKTIVTEAIEVLKGKCDDFTQKLKSM